MKTLTVLVLVLLPIVIFSCCSSKKQEEQSMAKISPYKGMSVIAGTAGGFSGISTGIKLNYSGECYHWSRRFGKETNEFLFKASPDSTEAIFRKITSSGFDTLKLNTAANVVNLLEVRRDSVAQQINWAQTDSTVPQAIIELYQSIQLFAEHNMPSK